MSFEHYIKNYKMERSEAILLRHLSDVYKTLSQTVPQNLKTEEIIDAENYLKDHLVSVDSSLIDEWELMRNPDYVPDHDKPKHQSDKPYTHNKKQLHKHIQEKIFTAVKYLAHDNLTELLTLFTTNDSDGSPWTIARLDPILDTYFENHHNIRLDPEARNKKHLTIAETNEPNHLKITQTITDDDLHNDWALIAILDLTESNQSEEPIITLESIGAI